MVIHLDNKDNETEVYHEDNSFNNQGVEPAQSDEMQDEQMQIPNQRKGGAFNNARDFAHGFKEGVKNGLNPTENNPALGINKKDKKNLNNNKNKNQQGNKNPAKGQQDKSKRKNPLPGGGLGDPAKRKRQQDNVDNANNKNKQNQQNKNGKNGDNKNGGLASKLNPMNRRRQMLGGLGGKDNSDNKSLLSKASSNVKVFLKAPIPLPIKIGIIVVAILIAPLLLLLLLILIIFIGSFIATISSSGSDSYCAGSDYDLSVLDSNPPSYTYTDVFNIKWDKSSAQYETLTSNKTYADEDGFLRSGDAYFIALGSYFGIETNNEKKLVMGTKYLIKLKNGVEFVGILADAKADAHTTESSQHAQHVTDKSVIEFEMACGSKINPVSYGFNFTGDYNTKCSGAQDAINTKFYGEIESISLLDESGANCVYDNGEFPIRTEYFSSEDMRNIFNVCGACETQKNYYPWECVTYAKLRAVEILLTARNISDEYRNKAIQAINNSRGNGKDWYAGTSSYPLKNFNHDSSCTKPKAGSMIAWISNSVYGHVGIIEAVEGDKVIVTDGYNSSHFNYYEVSIDELSTLGGIYKRCVGITYLFEYTG